MNYNKIVKNKRIYTKNSSLTFFFGGSFNEFKGLHIVLEAFTQITSDKISLKIYGSGVYEDYNDRLKLLAKDDERIEFCGVFSEDQIGDILNTVDVAIVPSLWYENYPLVLHEALACDVPVVASNIGGMAEKIKDGHNGYTFEVGNVESLRKTFEKIINNVLSVFQMTENKPDLPDNPIRFEGTFINSIHGGFYRQLAELEETVKEGDRVAIISDVFGETLEEIRAPFDGIVCSKRTTGFIEPGGWTLMVGKLV